MRISDYIEALGEILAEHGDLQVVKTEGFSMLKPFLPIVLPPRVVEIWEKPNSPYPPTIETKVTLPKRVLL